MSQENVEMARQIYDSFGTAGVDALIDNCLDEEVEWHDPPEMPDADTYQGHEEVRRHLNSLLNAFGEVEVTAEEIFDLADDTVLVYVHYRVEGAGSGIEIEFRPAHLWRFRDGKGVWLQVFLDRDKALEAAGLSE